VSLGELIAQPWLRVALLLAVGLAALALLAGLLVRRRRRMAPPEWPRLLADTEYYRRVLGVVFPAQGFQVGGYQVFQDPLETEAREIVYSLRRDGQLYAALCVRWIVPVTSDIVGRFERALNASQAHQGLIVTTSLFTEAARERARGLPVALYDREDLGVWIEDVWGKAQQH
jgi:hypothetical protein